MPGLRPAPHDTIGTSWGSWALLVVAACVVVATLLPLAGARHRMNPETISAELEALPRDDSFEWRTDELVDRWKRQEPGLEAVEPILRFMEGHRDVELGTPGALVQFVEGIEGYEDLLLASLARRPTPHTVWMLNRILNATKERNARSRLLLAMRNAGRHPDADDLTRQQAAHFLELQGEPRD